MCTSTQRHQWPPVEVEVNDVILELAGRTDLHPGDFVAAVLQLGLQVFSETGSLEVPAATRPPGDWSN